MNYRGFDVFCRAALATALLGAAAPPTLAQGDRVLEEVIVTSQRRAENVQEVPISVTPLSGERLDALFEGGADIRALAARAPGVYAESSNARLAPRFYIRGLGNTDFDLAASQPVSIIVDEVILENVILKSQPLFDVERVEVLRGPQGTLFGRNTPAGIIKFDTVKPSDEYDAHINATVGTLDTANVEAAVGGKLTDNLNGRLSYLYQRRGDWVDNDFTREKDALGGFEEMAFRLQLGYQASENFNALLNFHGRNYDGTSALFRANVLGPGTDGFNENFDRDVVQYDEGDNNPQASDGLGGSLRLTWDLANDMTLTTITAHESATSSSLGDIDGGFGADFLPFAGPCPPGFTPGDTCIPFPSQTRDEIDGLDQFTQEVRLSSDAIDNWFWQGGVYYFDSEFAVTTSPFFVPSSTVVHANTAWALFGQASHDVSDRLTLTGGIRYTDDEKDVATDTGLMPVSVSDDQVSWDFAALYALNDDVNLFGRIARGFRAPTIQGRDVAFGGAPSVAKSETIVSVEGGIKSDLMDGRARLNASIFYYQIEDQQLSAIGGGGNFVQLVNADKGTGYGFDVDGEFLIGDNLVVTAGLGYTNTEIDDSVLTAAPCGSGLCTLLDPLDANGNAIIDGNPFPNAPEWTANFTARYARPFGAGHEFFLFTDWAWQGETQFLIYDAAEFRSDGNFEGGLRLGLAANDGRYEVALFARNITDEENVQGAIDFNNLTGFGNEPRVVGASVRLNFD